MGQSSASPSGSAPSRPGRAGTESGSKTSSSIPSTADTVPARHCWVVSHRSAAIGGLTRLEWCVLKWNTPSIGFYESLGAKPQDEWETYRLDGRALAEFANSAQP